MTGKRTISAGLFLVLGLGVVCWWIIFGLAGPSVGPEEHAANSRIDADGELERDPGDDPEAGSASRSLIPMVPGVPEREASRLATQRIQVVDGRTGMAVPEATVLHVAPGFVWEQLDTGSRQEYSLSTERYLRRAGESQETDVHGMVEIPIEAAYQAVVGRKGELYGAGVDREEGEVWRLALSPCCSLTVEVFDARNLPVAGIRVMSRDSLLFNPFQMQPPLGTTDESGVVTHLFETPAPGTMPRVRSVFASLPTGNYGAFDFDPADPPDGPVRITLPATGSVTVLILDPSGSRLDPSRLGDPNVEIEVVDPAAPVSPGPPGAHSRNRRRARIDPDGLARFTNVVLGKTLSIRAALLGSPLEFRGPREGDLEVFVEHRMHRDHPAILGRLVDTEHQPLPNTQFSILCRSGGELLSLVGGRTDAEGWFEAYLLEKARGQRPDELSIGMAFEGLKQSRAVRVPLRVQLTGKIQVGEVVLPEE